MFCRQSNNLKIQDSHGAVFGAMVVVVVSLFGSWLSERIPATYNFFSCESAFLKLISESAFKNSNQNITLVILPWAITGFKKVPVHKGAGVFQMKTVFRCSFTLHKRKQKTYRSVISDIFDGKLVSSVQVESLGFRCAPTMGEISRGG